MRVTLPMTEPFSEEAVIPAKRWKKGSKLPIHPPGHQSFRPLELHEARDHSEMSWEPRCYVVNDNGDIGAIGFRSKTQRGQGWLGLNEDIGSRKMTCVHSPEGIRGILSSLHQDGVRTVGVEVDAVKEAKTPFLNAGFESLYTLYEQELILAYT
jgi:hypothetical protein